MILHIYIFLFICMAAEVLRYNSSLDCRYCKIFSFTNNKSLSNHLRRNHYDAEAVNRRDGLAITPYTDMTLCKVCNIFLDRGLSYMKSSHQYTAYHLQNLSNDSMNPPTHVYAKKRRVGAAASTLSDGEDGGSGGSNSEIIAEGDMNRGDHVSFTSFVEDEERYLDEDEAEDEEEEEQEGDQGREGEELDVKSRHHDWMAPHRDDHLVMKHMDPEIGGWVFNCPFNSDYFPFTGTVGGMGAAAQNPDNYARFRVVDQFTEHDVITGTEVDVKLN